MVRPRRSSAASEESAGTARDQVCFLGQEWESADSEAGTGKHVRLSCKDHSSGT